MKKGLKIGLIVGGSFLIVLGAWAGLTKAGIIPNWLEIEALYPGNCINCNGEVFWHEPVFSLREQPPTMNGKECCEGTYTYKVNHNLRKPIIYLYPMQETEVNVTLGTPENLLHTYPKYNSEKGRNVVAQPNGELEDMDIGRKLYALYREGKSYTEDKFEEGFVVKGEDTISFLEEKLAILGLNEREAEEFIVYRLPQMEKNEYNLIRFETKEEQDENMPLNITPTPDTVIRVMMDWKAIKEPIYIPEQELVTPTRTGFTVVEWGGSPRN